MTTQEEQIRENARWRLRSQFAHLKWFDDLFVNEFADASVQLRLARSLLQPIIKLAVHEVPFYRARWSQAGVDFRAVQTPADLPLLPVLTRRDVIVSYEELQPRRLPPEVRLAGTTKSSGTTGPPVRVRTTTLNTAMYSILWQRQARNFCMDPNGVLCQIRDGGDVERMPDGSPNPDGRLVKYKRWKFVGTLFETGRSFAFNITNPYERQLDWLKQIQPDYLLTDVSMLEELAHANGGKSPCTNIKGVLALGSQVSDSARRQIERFYGVPVHQTYGLNEIGKVGVRCREGRYHVHREHCWAEIVDDSGNPTPPGEVGRIVVTAFRNPSMPLIRYDTGDLAKAVEGPCPCGRTLPSFGEIVGRFRRYAGLPEGTRERFDAVQAAIADAPVELLSFLRQFQLHQFRDNRFELRLHTVDEVPERFIQMMMKVWASVDANAVTPLDIVRVDQIARSNSGKARDFTSDFHQETNDDSD